MSSYLLILNGDDCREGEEPPIGIIEYIMQDFLQPMGVVAYKTADEMNPELLKVLPPKEELQILLENSKEGTL